MIHTKHARISYRIFRFGGGGKHYEKEGGGGGCDEKEGSGRQIPMSINMPQLIFQRVESAPPLPSQMSQAALSGGQSLGEGGLLLGGGGNPRFPPRMKPCMQIGNSMYFALE